MGEKKAKASWVRPAAEVQEALDRQIRLIRSSCRGYDEGTHEEALRLATGVFVILDDNSQRSLITQLGQRAKFQPYDSAHPDTTGNVIPYTALVGFGFSPTKETHYSPIIKRVSSPPSKIRLSHWWEKNVIYDNRSGYTITRRKLAHSLRNQDGGSHFDPGLTDPSYVNLSRENGAGWSTDNGPLKDIHFAMMRTIAWELDTSLVDAGLVSGHAVIPNDG